jgi:hypothetical protein
MELKKTLSIVLTSTLLLSMLLVAIPKAFAQTTEVYLTPSPVSVTTLNQVFTVDCRIDDVADLAGFDLQLKWNTTVLEYVSHTVPLGVLIAPTFTTKDDVNTTAGTYWLAAATLSGTGFTGSGVAFTMTFKAIYVPFGPVPSFFDEYINFTNDDLADSAAIPISHTTTDGVVRIYYREFVYPPVPLLQVNPASYEAGSLGESFDISVWLLGNGLTDLDPFWDVAGIDVYMNFNATLMQAISVNIDPDGEFASFWPNNLTLLVNPPEINNIDGYVRVAYIGVPGPSGSHTAPFGQINMFTVTFNATYESTSYPPPTAPITLKNPTAYTGAYFFDSIGGLVNLASPVGSHFNELSPHFVSGTKEMTSWADNGDGQLGIDDQIMLEDFATGFYFDYHINDIKGTLNVTLARSLEDYIWAASFGPANLGDNGLPGRFVGADDPYNGYGVPNWTGNFSMPYPVQSVNSITVHALPFTGDEYNYTLTEGVDYIVHDAENTIELLNPVDVQIINEHWVDGVNNTLNGWPFINYVASGIESVYVDMHNGTARFANNNGYANGPPGEWWFDPDWTWELEGWWALGYYPGAWNWPDGSEWWINYTAASYMTVDYNTDPTTAFVDYSGTYADFLAVTDPTGTTWNEVYPKNWQSYTIIGWTDSDTSGTLTVGDWLAASGSRFFRVDSVGTDLVTLRKPWICEDDPADPFFGVAPIVQVAGFPQPGADYCPWHKKPYSVPLPHVVQNGVYTAPYKALGGFIDVYVCPNVIPWPFNGAGKDKPADMRWPQKDLCLCANVTYAGWPEQNKDVAFEIKFPNGTAYVVMYNRTNDVGVACVRVRLPWPCDDPEAIIGKWKVWATVDVACVVVNDTMEFKYDYKVNIWNVSADKDEYKHSEDITVTVDYGTYSMQEFNITFTLTVTDASGVPIGFDYLEVTVGGAVWCTYANGTLTLTVNVPKWARPPLGTIYVGALSDFPQNGGSAETPVYVINIAILAE